MASENDELGQHLEDGWDVCGFDVCLFAAGATSHNILLRKGNSLKTFTVLNNGGKEIGRSIQQLTPWEPPAPKKGFFG